MKARRAFLIAAIVIMAGLFISCDSQGNNEMTENNTIHSIVKSEILKEYTERGIDDRRLRIISFAMEAEGKIPYFFAGKASCPNYDGNDFGKEVEPADYKGRNLKGLDCSHFVDWVYWSTVGDDLGNGNTRDLRQSSKLTETEELMPGDIVLRGTPENGHDAHTGIFIGYYDGVMIYVSEDGGTDNNVVMHTPENDETAFHKLADFEKIDKNGVVSWKTYIPEENGK